MVRDGEWVFEEVGNYSNGVRYRAVAGAVHPVVVGGA